MTTATLPRLARRISRRMVESAATTVCFLGGLALIALGVALVALPAGLIVAGIELACAAVLYERGRT